MPTIAAVVLQAEQSSDPLLLRTLGERPEETVRRAVAENPATDDGTLARLLHDLVDVVRATAATGLADRPQLHDDAARSPDRWVRAILAHTYARDDRRSLALPVQRLLAADDFDETRGRVGATTDDPEVFAALLDDASPRVRAWCASNPRISRAQMERLVTDPIRHVRAGAAANGLRWPDDDQLLRLAHDRSVEVRWAVVFRVDRPREALEVVARDSDEWNRRHAELALQDERNINADQVVASARTERARVRDLRPFDD